MFIIADGILEVIGEDGTLLRQMSAGDFFGEIGILNLDCGLNRRSADVRSVGYSELFTLSREDVLAAMRDYPEAESIIKEYGRIRLIEAKKHNIPTPTVVVTTLDVVKDTSQSCSSSSADGATNATQNVQPSNAESEREGAAEVVCESTNRNQADSSSTTNPREDSWEEVTSPAPLASVDEEHEESPKDVASEIIEYTVKAVHQKLDEIRDRCEETITTLEKDIARKNEVIEELEAKVELLEMCHNY